MNNNETNKLVIMTRGEADFDEVQRDFKPELNANGIKTVEETTKELIKDGIQFDTLLHGTGSLVMATTRIVEALYKAAGMEIATIRPYKPDMNIEIKSARDILKQLKGARTALLITRFADSHEIELALLDDRATPVPCGKADLIDTNAHDWEESANWKKHSKPSRNKLVKEYNMTEFNFS